VTETLRVYLERGGRLNVDVHRSLIEAMTSPLSADQRGDRAVAARYEFDTLSDGGDPQPERHLTPGQRLDAVQATGFLADYLEGGPDPELDQMIRAALPLPLELHLDAQTVPHRIRVGVPDGGSWSCDNCRATSEAIGARALLISDRPGASSLHRDIVICAECVAAAAETLQRDAT